MNGLFGGTPQRTRLRRVTTALYRRYRPETFAEVIGQEHVTAPLMQALRSGRVNHAYLFSGPRGCGKTTSARILARTLNCEANTPKTPLDTPCGECPSCLDLARGGPGSLDVVEIDAASHGGVDDARELRERATYAPARDRYKIFIIDEAHMVTNAGFNALLKIVEEPPPHIKFVFATTEPDKVIGTIRSRTHHYPFRLVPPDVLGPYLTGLAEAESVALDGGVVPLVVRAGEGSVRDSLSVLDQLIAGASDNAVSYDLAVNLLGYTHSSLLDDVVEALAARDGAALFRIVDQVIATGHAPQRFVDDLLERLRDLIVFAVSGDDAIKVLRGLPADVLERMAAQAGRLGMAELSRAADLTNAALTEMHGATSPRLHLELLCARLLLPGADEGAAGLAARIERLERGGLAAGGGTPAPMLTPASAPQDTAAVMDTSRSAASEDSVPPPSSAEKEPTSSLASGMSGLAAARAALRDETPVNPVILRERSESQNLDPVVTLNPGADDSTPPAQGDGERASAPQPAQDGASSTTGERATPAVTTEVLRRRWNEVLGNISADRAREFLRQHAQVLSLENGTLRLGFTTTMVNAARSGNPQTISDAVYETVGVQATIDIVANEETTPVILREQSESQNLDPAAATDPGFCDSALSAPDEDEVESSGSIARNQDDAAPAHHSAGDEVASLDPGSTALEDDEDAAWLAGASLALTGDQLDDDLATDAPLAPEVEPDPFDDASVDDPDQSGLAGVALAMSILDATIIEEIIDEG